MMNKGYILSIAIPKAPFMDLLLQLQVMNKTEMKACGTQCPVEERGVVQKHHVITIAYLDECQVGKAQGASRASMRRAFV